MIRTVTTVFLPGFLFFAHSIFGQAINNCDLNSDRVVNNADVLLAVDMTIGKVPCTANVSGANVCNVGVVQKVVNSSLGSPCGTVISQPHSVTLNWGASPSSGVMGYNVHRGTASGGPYTLLTTASRVAGTSYVDSTVQSGLTYYYVITAVNSSNQSSTYSNQATAVIPTP